VQPDNDYANSGKIVMAAMQDWIAKCERGLARLCVCVAAFACLASAAHALDLTETHTITLWELIASAGILAAFFVSILIWIYSAHRRVRLRQRRRAKFASSAMNNMPHGIMMADAQRRMVFCNDRYLEIYRLSRSEIRPRMPVAEVLAMRKARGDK